MKQGTLRSTFALQRTTTNLESNYKALETLHCFTIYTVVLLSISWMLDAHGTGTPGELLEIFLNLNMNHFLL